MPKTLLLATSVISLFLFSGCTQQSTDTFSASDVAEHNKDTDCWMIIEGKVLDVTDFISLHPGGAELIKGCGQDASLLFATKGGENEQHSATAREIMQRYVIGDLK